VPDLWNEILLIFQRLNWLSVLDLFLVTAVFFGVLLLVKDTQAMALLRGVFLLVVALSLLTSLVDLPAFSWLVKTTLPALLFAIPVIFAPEIRRALEKLGRAGAQAGALIPRNVTPEEIMQQRTIKAVVTACSRLSTRQHGALIILQRNDHLTDYVLTGVHLDADVTPELLLQVFYPNTPLHDGAAIISEGRLVAAACVMPLSASGVLNRTPDRQMGLRHRAALGISEASDAVAVVVSEETGSISIAHAGRMIRRLDSERLENILNAFYRPARTETGMMNWLNQIFPFLNRGSRHEED
jgi:diadenylate cyclase